MTPIGRCPRSARIDGQLGVRRNVTILTSLLAVGLLTLLLYWQVDFSRRRGSSGRASAIDTRPAGGEAGSVDAPQPEGAIVEKAVESPGAANASDDAPPQRVAVRFRFVGAAGEPVPRAKFKVFRDGVPVALGRADRNGAARAMLEAGGDHVIVAEARQHPSVWVPFPVGIDAPLDVHFPESVSVTGEVTMMNGTPLTGCVVTATPVIADIRLQGALAHLLVSGSTNATGEFRIDRLNPSFAQYELRLPESKRTPPLLAAPGADGLRIRCAPAHLLCVRRGADRGALRWRVIAARPSHAIQPYSRQTSGELPVGTSEVWTPLWPGESTVEFRGAGRGTMRTARVRLSERGDSVVVVDPGPGVRDNG